MKNTLYISFSFFRMAERNDSGIGQDPVVIEANENADEVNPTAIYLTIDNRLLFISAQH